MNTSPRLVMITVCLPRENTTQYLLVSILYATDKSHRWTSEPHVAFQGTTCYHGVLGNGVFSLRMRISKHSTPYISIHTEIDNDHRTNIWVIDKITNFKYEIRFLFLPRWTLLYSLTLSIGRGRHLDVSWEYIYAELCI